MIHMMNTAQIQQHWLAHITMTQDSKLPLTDHAKKHQLDLKKLYYWSAPLKKKGFYGCPNPEVLAKVKPTKGKAKRIQ
jgi:hypothetical protein